MLNVLDFEDPSYVMRMFESLESRITAIEQNIKQPDYKLCVDDIRVYVNNMIKDNNVYDVEVGNQILEIINKHIK